MNSKGSRSHQGSHQEQGIEEGKPQGTLLQAQDASNTAQAKICP
jgi:hypothetical protein